MLIIISPINTWEVSQSKNTKIVVYSKIFENNLQKYILNYIVIVSNSNILCTEKEILVIVSP